MCLCRYAEVEEICDFIGNQQAYPTAYQLPEYVGEEGGGVGDIDPSDRDVSLKMPRVWWSQPSKGPLL